MANILNRTVVAVKSKTFTNTRIKLTRAESKHININLGLRKVIKKYKFRKVIRIIKNKLTLFNLRLNISMSRNSIIKICRWRWKSVSKRGWSKTFKTGHAAITINIIKKSAFTTIARNKFTSDKISTLIKNNFFTRYNIIKIVRFYKSPNFQAWPITWNMEFRVVRIIFGNIIVGIWSKIVRIGRSRIKDSIKGVIDQIIGRINSLVPVSGIRQSNRIRVSKIYTANSQILCPCMDTYKARIPFWQTSQRS